MILYAYEQRNVEILLAYYLDTDPRILRFVTNAYGKPALASPHLGANLHFNLSHSRILFCMPLRLTASSALMWNICGLS